MPELTAVWCPGWYDLDQELAVGKRETLRFAISPGENDVAETGRRHAVTPDAVLYSGLAGDDLWFILDAEVLEMTNSHVGPINSIASNGHEYVLQLGTGCELVLNCEEHPGATWDAHSQTWELETQSHDWTVVVKVKHYQDTSQ